MRSKRNKNTQKQQENKNSSSVKVIFYLVLSSIIIYGTAIFTVSITKYLDNLEVKGLQVNSSNQYVKNALERYLNSVRGEKILNPILLSSVHSYLNSLSWIQSANVKRNLANGTLEINILEVNPYFLWLESENNYRVIDSNNQIVSSAKVNYNNLITIEEGEEALNQSMLLRFLIYKDLEILKKIDTLKYNGYRWDIILRNGILIKLPEDNITQSLENIARAHYEHNILNKNIEYIDATTNNKLFIMPIKN